MGENGVTINGKKVHLVIYVLLFILVVASAVWNIAGVRAEKAIAAELETVPMAVQLYVERSTMSKKDFNEFRREYKQDFKDLRIFIEESAP
ncbi:unnamed protein product [marine sediment metagenome]|uniref:Uncharacterized protein n=1 Tax=marine sediment metagenome TaxID=412755 RepID=X0UCB7_9ZZZZ